MEHIIKKKHIVYLKFRLTGCPVIFICKIWQPDSRWHWFTNLEPVGLQLVPSQQELWVGKSLKFLHWNLEGRWRRWSGPEQGPPAWVSPPHPALRLDNTVCPTLQIFPNRGQEDTALPSAEGF